MPCEVSEPGEDLQKRSASQHDHMVANISMPPASASAPLNSVPAPPNRAAPRVFVAHTSRHYRLLHVPRRLGRVNAICRSPRAEFTIEELGPAQFAFSRELCTCGHAVGVHQRQRLLPRRGAAVARVHPSDGRVGSSPSTLPAATTFARLAQEGPAVGADACERDGPRKRRRLGALDGRVKRHHAAMTLPVPRRSRARLAVCVARAGDVRTRDGAQRRARRPSS